MTCQRNILPTLRGWVMEKRKVNVWLSGKADINFHGVLRQTLWQGVFECLVWNMKTEYPDASVIFPVSAVKELRPRDENNPYMKEDVVILRQV